MKKIALLLSLSLVVGSCFTGCSYPAATAPVDSVESTPEEAEVEESEEMIDQETIDQMAADKVAELIDAIYVQERNENTDEQCKAAKEAWDALTDAQKELVEGEDADPDYFGRDTGDAGLDNPLNFDRISEKEILVVSFGTSFNDSRAKDIGGIEKKIAEAFPDWSVRRAFTAQIIINHIQARDNEFIDNMDQALERAVNNGVKQLIVQPTHLMRGAEYDELVEAVKKYEDSFEMIAIPNPLLGEVGEDSTIVNQDKETVAKAIAEEALKESGFKDMAEAEDNSVAYVFMGHGTSHKAAVTYDQMNTQFKLLDYKNVFVGTVEGEPEDTEVENVINAVKEAGYKNVVLRPLMIVAGDHANNDMAGDDEDSWKSLFEASGEFDTVTTQISGLGRIEAIEQIYIDHITEVLNSIEYGEADAAEVASESSELENGTYTAEFDTDSSMFHVNEACDGKGVLTVNDGEMVLHISLTSKNIVNLFPGLAEDAKKDGAELLEPTTDTVTYSDGATEEVNGFDVPVPYLNEEFDLALIGTKGKWYDHKVKVSNPILEEDTKKN